MDHLSRAVHVERIAGDPEGRVGIAERVEVDQRYEAIGHRRDDDLAIALGGDRDRVEITGSRKRGAELDDAGFAEPLVEGSIGIHAPDGDARRTAIGMGVAGEEKLAVRRRGRGLHPHG